MPIQLALDQFRKSFEVETVTIGRAAENVFCLPDDDRLLPRHATLRNVRGRWLVEAVPGAKVRVGNGRPVDMAWLNGGEVIHLTENGPDILFEVVDSIPVSATTVSAAPPQAKSAVTTATTIRPTSLASSPEGGESSAIPFPLSWLKRPEAESAGTSLGGGTPLVVPPAKMLRDQKSRRRPGGIGFIIRFLIINCLSLGVTAWLGGLLPWKSPLKFVSMSQRQIAPSASAPQAPLNPPQSLLRVGVCHDNGDEPLSLGVGWCWDQRTLVVPRELSYSLMGLIEAGRSSGSELKMCVVRGQPVEIKSIQYSDTCPEISILKLQDAIRAITPAQTYCEHWTATETAQLQKAGGKLYLFSYTLSPEESRTQMLHGMSVSPYQGGSIKQSIRPVHLELRQGRYQLSESPEQLQMQPGGLLLNSQQRIVGMARLDGSITWTDALESALK